MFDHYYKALELADNLEKEDICDFAEKIKLSIEEGSTGTEIFMALRFNIKKMLKKNKTLPLHIKNKALILLDEIEKGLK